MRGVHAVAQRRRCGGQLGARVDPVRGARVVRAVHDGLAPVRDEDAHGVCQVQLALVVVGGDVLERPPEIRCGEDVERRRHLVDRELLGRGVARLDDRAQAAVAVADDAPVRRSRRRLVGEDGHGRPLAAVRLDELVEKLGCEERRVAGRDEHVALEALERGARAGRGVPGAAGAPLDGGRLAREGVLRLLRDDDDDRVGARGARGAGHPVDHPAAEQGMQVLRRRGAHPCAEPGGHDDGGEWVEGRHRLCWGARIRTWDRGTKTRCLTTWLRPSVGSSCVSRDR